MKRLSWSGERLQLFAFALLAAGVCAGQSAKELADQGKTAADQCVGLKLMCRAAAMDKKYQKDCDDFKVSLNKSGNRDLASGYDKLDAKLYPSAVRYANSVCDYDPTMAAKKHELLDAIKNAQAPVVAQSQPVAPQPTAPVVVKDEVSPVKAAEVQRDFASGDFQGAVAAARLVTDKELQKSSIAIEQKIASYNNAFADGRQKEGGDPQGAIRSYRDALSIAPQGPGDPAGRIAALEARLRPAPTRPSTPVDQPIVAGTRPQPQPQPGLRPTGPDPSVEAARLNGEARQAEAHNLQQAMRLFEGALRVQPGNPEATAGLARVQETINSDPKEQAKVLADAIRAFYGLNYAEAEDDLTSYLSSTTAKYRGAAYFYLGASRLYREILDGSGQKVREAENSAQVQRPFKDARSACYRPVGKYLSPVVLSAWNASSSSAVCAR